LGGTGVYHLFRLPGSLEANIHDSLSQSGPRLDVLIDCAAGDDAMEVLARLAGAERVEAVSGPVNCGRVSTLQSGRALQRVCAAYLGALRAGVAVFPYLEPDPE
jgi:hypothetical protein